MKSVLEKIPYYETVREFLAHYLGGLYRRMDEYPIFLMAGGLAFSIFICMVPFVLIVFFLLGTILEEASVEQQIDRIVDTAIPYTQYASFVKHILFSRVREIVAYRNVYGLVGILGLLFTASGLFSSMRTILNAVYRVSAQKNEAVGKLRDFGMVFLVLCFFLLSITLFPVLEAVKDATFASPFLRFLRFNVFEKYAYSALSFLSISGVFAVLYLLVPYEKPGRKTVAVSALSTAVLWEIAEQGFGYYINHIASMDRIYGAYALAVVVVLWVYYASVVFVLGAAIGQLHRERAAPRAQV